VDCPFNFGSDETELEAFAGASMAGLRHKVRHKIEGRSPGEFNGSTRRGPAEHEDDPYPSRSGQGTPLRVIVRHNTKSFDGAKKQLCHDNLVWINRSVLTALEDSHFS
jgi:hypothetical protein